MPNKGLSSAVLCLLLLGFTRHQFLLAQAPTEFGTITGRVVDMRTGEPIAKATVSVAGLPKNAAANHAVSDSDGRFTLPAVSSGTVELHIFTVGYGLLKTHVDVKAGATIELEFRIGQEAIHDVQQVTVVAGPFDPVVPDAVSQYSLNNSELQDLSTILANDPLRAVSSLPGVSSNQDYYADFATRGAGPPNIGVYLDGVLLDHPSYSLEDSGGLGSLSVVNGDVVGTLSLLSGAFPATYGNRTGAILDITTRNGARDRVATRVIADVLGIVITSEGPIGKAKKASWLVSGRQSYLGYLLARLGDSGALTLNYNDATGKLNYDFNAHHKLSFDTSFGSNSALQSPNYTDGQEASFFTKGGAQHGMNAIHWDWIASQSTLLQAQGFWVHDHEHDTNLFSAVNLDTTSNVYGFRADFTHQSRQWNKFQTGVESRSPFQQRNSYTQWNYTTDTVSNNLLPFDNYSQTVRQSGAYIQDTMSLLNNRVSLGVGIRWAYFMPASQNVWLPHASALLKATRTTNLALAFGQYAQAPSLLQLYGAFGNRSLQAERATHETFVIDQSLSEKLRLHVELYNRQEHGDIYSPLTEFRLLANNQVGFPVLGSVLANSLKGYARGFEVSIQRRSANRLSGWIAYARSYSKDWQPNTSLNFQGDYDQRDTFSVYGAYRITRSIDVSGDARYGTGQPIPGFLAPLFQPLSGSSSSVLFQLSNSRNTLHQDDFFRSDVRVNKVFTAKHFNLTVHGELENLTGHTNYNYYGIRYPGIVAASRQVNAIRQSTLPFLPAAGFTFEF
jgi:hypothetical protein